VSACSLGLPDLGVITMDDVLVDLNRITSASELPVLVDIDTGWGSSLNVGRAVRSMARAGAAAVQIEDQVEQKRCGHRPGKALVPAAEMAERIAAAVDARTDPDFAILARTDALAVEGLEPALDRARRYVEAGADMVFPEAATSLEQYQRFAEATRVPVLANMTEFGVTPLFTTEELRGAGVGLALYPLSAFRAMSAAALAVYQTLRRDGTQKAVLGGMETRESLYAHLGYHALERKLDALRANKDHE
jgi:methylisocitrate lyase